MQTARDRALRKLDAYARSVQNIERTLDEARRDRDSQIGQAIHLGATRSAVASAARVSRGWVQKVIQHNQEVSSE